jgi:hypothetical protein
MMQRKVYVGMYDKKGNLAQVKSLSVRQFQANFENIGKQRVSRETYRAFNQKYQTVESKKMAA